MTERLGHRAEWKNPHHSTQAQVQMTRCWYFDQVHVYFGFAPKNTPLSGDKVVLRPESGGEISLPADTDGSNRLHSMTVVRQSRNDYYGLSDVVRSCNLLLDMPGSP